MWASASRTFLCTSLEKSSSLLFSSSITFQDRRHGIVRGPCSLTDDGDTTTYGTDASHSFLVSKDIVQIFGDSSLHFVLKNSIRTSLNTMCHFWKRSLVHTGLKAKFDSLKKVSSHVFESSAYLGITPRSDEGRWSIPSKDTAPRLMIWVGHIHFESF